MNGGEVIDVVHFIEIMVGPLIFIKSFKKILSMSDSPWIGKVINTYAFLLTIIDGFVKSRQNLDYSKINIVESIT